MGARKRKPEPYRSGGCTLGRREGEYVADFRDEGTGKRRRVRLGRYRSLKQAKAALDRFAETRRAIAHHKASYTVGDLWRTWLAERLQDGFNNDIYEAHWVSLGPAFESRIPDLLTTNDFREYARQRFEAGRSPWTVHTELVRLRACLKWSAETHLIEKRPKVWVPTPGKSRERVLTFDEARALVAGAHQGDAHIYLFTVIAFATGARHMAILDLTWDRVDFVEGVIEFDEDLPPDPMSKAWRKGRATVPMNRAVRAALEVAYAARQTDYVIEHGGRRLTSVRDGFRNAVERAGLGSYGLRPKDASRTMFVTDVTPHTIRHTVVTWLDERQVEARRTAQLVGHKDERTTKQVYTHTSHEVLKQAVDVLDDAFAPLPRIGHSEAPKATENVPKSKKLSQRDKIKRRADADDERASD